MGFIKDIGNIFSTGNSAAKRQAEEQSRIQREAMAEQKRQFEEQQKLQEERNVELKAQQEAFKNQSDLQSQLAQEQASMAEDDSAEIQIGADLGTGATRKRKRKPSSGSSAVGLT